MSPMSHSASVYRKFRRGRNFENRARRSLNLRHDGGVGYGDATQMILPHSAYHFAHKSREAKAAC